MFFAPTYRPIPQGSLRRYFRPILVLLALLSAPLLQADISAAEVRAMLSEESTTVGEPVQLTIQIEGGRPTAPPRDIRVDGLDVSYIGTNQSSQITFGRGGMRSVSETSYTYNVNASRAGLFTIPALDIEVDGRTVRTQPVTLRVQGGRGGGGGGLGGGAGADAPLSQTSFVEIILPKKTAYLGETLPTEVRLFVDSRIRWEPATMPDLQGEGFTKTKMPQPQREQVRRDGKDYDVLVFQTALTPSKAGTVRIGPAELIYRAQIPRARPNRGRSPFDIFGDDMFSAVQERKATADPVDLEVKPLPSAGRPASFSGAVGKFTLSAEGSPTTVKIGDPLTMTLQVSGSGDFDRMSAPVLADRTGWRTYPASSSFKPEDDLAYRGTKTFQVAVIPETKKTAMPRFEFSYFDPAAEKYVTLTSEATPLNVEGTAMPTPAPTPVRPSQGEAKPPAAPEKAEAPAPMVDILGLRYDDGAPASFTPIYERREFWLAQLVPLLGLVGMLSARALRSRAASRDLSALRREKSAQLARMQRVGERTEFLDAAARAVQIDTALVTGQEPGAVDAVAACRSRPLAPNTAAAIQEIFDSRAESLFAGSANEAGSLPSDERARFVAAILDFEKSHGRN